MVLNPTGKFDGNKGGVDADKIDELVNHKMND